MSNEQNDSKDLIKSWIIIILGALLATILYFILPEDGYTSNEKKGLSLLLFVAILWFTEAVHITITAVLVPVLAVFMGIEVSSGDKMIHMSLKNVLTNFANPVIYLFFGGFALATALHVQKLDKKIAMKIVSISGSNLGYATFAICSVTAILSMWISNTATAAMMLPLVLGLISQLDEKEDKNTFIFILLAVAYSASIGGLGTMVGSPPNAIAASNLNLDFIGWMKIGFPIMAIIFPIMFVVLYLVFRPKLNRKIDVSIEEIPWTPKRIATLVIFILTAICWIFSKKIANFTGLGINDAFIALTATCIIAILGLATWKDIAKGTDWGVLLLFGGGLTLSYILKVSGASLVLGRGVADIFGHAPFIVIIAVVTIFIIILTEFTSNTASAALLVPVFATIASEIGMPKETLVMVIGIGASCAFMLPVATPPNAIVYGTGFIRQKDMMKGGFFLSLSCIVIITLYTNYILM